MRVRRVVVAVLLRACLGGFVTPNGDQWDGAAERAYAALAAEGAVPDAFKGAAPVTREGDGVVYAVGGGVDFARQEFLPCVRYLADLLKDGPATRFALFYERAVLRDLNSLNGCFVNNVRIKGQREALSHGDNVRFGFDTRIWTVDCGSEKTRRAARKS